MSARCDVVGWGLRSRLALQAGGLGHLGLPCRVRALMSPFHRRVGPAGSRPGVFLPMVPPGTAVHVDKGPLCHTWASGHCDPSSCH